MPTVTGLFDTHAHAVAAVNALDQAGIGHADISMVSGNAPEVQPDDVGDGAATGAEIGAGLGAAGGLLAGLGIVAIPGLGLVAAAGWLIATALGAVAGAGVGAATGGLVGALTGEGVEEADAHVIAESIRRGGAMVTVRVDEARLDAARAILNHAEGIDLADRRKALELEGWTRFGDSELEIERRVEDERVTEAEQRYPLVPPIV